MSNGQDISTGLLLVRTHPFPQVSRVVTAKRLHGRIGLNLDGLVPVITKNYVAVQIVGAGIRGPFVTNEGSKTARLVGFLGCFNCLLPRVAIRRASGKIDKVFRKRTV